MKTTTCCSLFAAVILAGIAVSTSAQQVTIPDAGLDTAIRSALQKPTGPLTQATITNSLGSISFTATNAHLYSRKFYRARSSP